MPLKYWLLFSTLLVFHCLTDATEINRKREISCFFLAVANEHRLRDHKLSAQTLGDKNSDEFTV